MYVLDEPSIGLHQRDNDRLIQSMKEMRDLGNTLIVVEHDEDTMRASDYIVDIGPGAGVHGGGSRRLRYAGTGHGQRKLHYRPAICPARRKFRIRLCAAKAAANRWMSSMPPITTSST